MKPTLPNEKVLEYQFLSFEKIPVSIWEDDQEASLHIAKSIALAIRQKQQEGEMIVLGLATGSSPIKIYRELIRMHQKESLSFRNVITFNLDEYYPMPPDARQSYVRFMNEMLFDHIDINKDNVHIPDGTISLDQVHDYCEAYEKKIKAAGGIDIQLLGIGRTGHAGFNEPGSRETSLTRIVRLDNLTRRDAGKDFPTMDDVPYRALTMGLGTILSARAIYLVAWGSHKAQIIKQTVEGEISSLIPASLLQKHNNTKFHIDQSAGEELTRIKTPWLVGMCKWDLDLMCKAVIWLSTTLEIPILKLTDEDYNENGLSELILEYNSAYEVNLKVFNRLQHTITGWPGGKPNADDTTRPERAQPSKKRVIIFSPHPDDDVISMGGTFIRLVEQGHDVHVAYQTSGNIAVHDHDALRFLEFLRDFGHAQDLLGEGALKKIQKMEKFLASKGLNQSDIVEVKAIKGYIRQGEARAGAKYVGLKDDHIHFLNMPFYETGKLQKKPIGPTDIKIVTDLMEEVKPHQVYAAGDLADPHGTHRVCLEAIFQAFEQLKTQKWMTDCWLWLYRGAWHEWSIDEIEMVVPLSPEELLKKRRAVYMHQSQKDSPPFPGDDNREFWVRAEQRNRATAKIYRNLGFAEYEAMEAFRRYKF